MRVVDARLATLEEWNAAWARCDWASYFQSRSWADVWHRWRPGTYEPRAFALQLEDGLSVVLPMVIEHRAGGLLRVARLSVADTYGGWLSAVEMTPPHAAAIVSWAQDTLGDMTWAMNPYDPTIAGRQYPDALVRATLVVNLSQGFDAIRGGWSKGHRSAVSQAQRLGVAVRLATDRSEWDAYGACYSASFRRWGDSSGAPAWGVIRSLSEEPSDAVSLLVATSGGSVVSGAICLTDRHVMTYWHAASLPEGLRIRAPTLLVQEAIRMAVNSGRRVFDLGGSGGHEGVERFKLGFRPERLAYSILVHEGRTLKMARKARDVRRTLH